MFLSLVSPPIAKNDKMTFFSVSKCCRSRRFHELPLPVMSNPWSIFFWRTSNYWFQNKTFLLFILKSLNNFATEVIKTVVKMNVAINIGIEDLVSQVIRTSLYVGAFFQLICIFACIILPESVSEESSWKNVSIHGGVLRFVLVTVGCFLGGGNGGWKFGA